MKKGKPETEKGTTLRQTSTSKTPCNVRIKRVKTVTMVIIDF